VAGHSIKQNTGYFEDIMVLSDLPYYTSRIIQETMEDKFNREGACQLSPALKKIIHTVKQ
jgi:hypothetical protein